MNIEELEGKLQSAMQEYCFKNKSEECDNSTFIECNLAACWHYEAHLFAIGIVKVQQESKEAVKE